MEGDKLAELKLQYPRYLHMCRLVPAFLVPQCWVAYDLQPLGIVSGLPRLRLPSPAGVTTARGESQPMTGRTRPDRTAKRQPTGRRTKAGGVFGAPPMCPRFS